MILSARTKRLNLGQTRARANRVINAEDGKMRSLNSWMSLARLSLLFSIITVACGDDDPPCGDSVCDSADGETKTTCPEDCTPCGNGHCDENTNETVYNCPMDCSVCGDGVCLSQFGETRYSCPIDCLICTNPDYPTNCLDGFCWSPGADCSSDLFECHGDFYRCAIGGYTEGNCCAGVFLTCPSDTPYWCPSANECRATESECPSQSCDFRGLSCY